MTSSSATGGQRVTKLLLLDSLLQEKRWHSLRPPGRRLSRRGQRSSLGISLTGMTSSSATGGGQRVLTTELGGSSRECTRCPTLVMVQLPAPGTCSPPASRRCWFTREGAGGLDDDQQDLLRRDCSRSL